MPTRRVVLVATVVMAVIGLVVLARTTPVAAWLGDVQSWTGDHLAASMAAFIGAFILATVLFAPGAPLTIAAGALFGVAWGTVAVSIGSTIGAALAFLVARYLARDRVARWLADRPRTRAVDAAIQRGGWKVVALLRLSPVVPFNLQNYAYGLTGIRFWPFLFSSWLAMLPGTLMYVYAGYVAGEFAAKRMRPAAGGLDATTVATAVGLVATVVVTIYIAVLARRELAEMQEAPE